MNEELVERARMLRPLLAEGGDEGARQRRLPDKTVQALTEAGLFRLMVPSRYGGYAESIKTLLDVSSVVAEGDGAAGWIVSLTATSAWMAGMFPEQAQDEVFGATPDPVVCSSCAPNGSATRADGGWHLSGRWFAVSGSDHADWAVLGFMLPGESTMSDGYAKALVPVSGLTVDDTWFTTGMRATGSNAVTAENVFVPYHRVLPGAALLTGDRPNEVLDETYYGAVFPWFSLNLVGPVLGIARAALEYVRTAALTKGIVATKFRRQADSTGFQLQLAEAALRVDTAHLHAYRAAADLDGYAARHVHPEPEARTRMIADSAWAAQQLVAATSILANAHGSGAFANASPLHRMFEDLNIVARHVSLNASVSLEIYGKAMLGLEPDITFAV